MEFRVVYMRRRLERAGRIFKPLCPVTACKREADHEIKRGPKWVWRGCATHAFEECDRRNAEVSDGDVAA